MTNGAAGGVGQRREDGHLRVVGRRDRVATSAVSSVLPRTRPSPGKCLSVAVTPASASPATIVPAAGSPPPAVPPYCRPKAPIGSLVRLGPGGTTSTTGARSRLTPARPAPPQPVGERGQLARPAARPARGPWAAGRSPALQRLDLAALLVDGDPQPRAGRALLPALAVAAASSLAGGLRPPARNSRRRRLGQRVAAVEVVEPHADDEQLGDLGAPVEPGQRGVTCSLRASAGRCASATGWTGSRSAAWPTCRSRRGRTVGRRRTRPARQAGAARTAAWSARHG